MEDDTDIEVKNVNVNDVRDERMKLLKISFIKKGDKEEVTIVGRQREHEVF